MAVHQRRKLAQKSHEIRNDTLPLLYAVARMRDNIDWCERVAKSGGGPRTKREKDHCEALLYLAEKEKSVLAFLENKLDDRIAVDPYFITLLEQCVDQDFVEEYKVLEEKCDRALVVLVRKMVTKLLLMATSGFSDKTVLIILSETIPTLHLGAESADYFLRMFNGLGQNRGMNVCAMCGEGTQHFVVMKGFGIEVYDPKTKEHREVKLQYVCRASDCWDKVKPIFAAKKQEDRAHDWVLEEDMFRG